MEILNIYRFLVACAFSTCSDGVTDAAEGSFCHMDEAECCGNALSVSLHSFGFIFRL